MTQSTCSPSLCARLFLNQLRCKCECGSWRSTIPIFSPSQSFMNHLILCKGRQGANSHVLYVSYGTSESAEPSSGTQRASTHGTTSSWSRNGGSEGSSRARRASTAAICPPAESPPIDTREVSMPNFEAEAKVHLKAAQESQTCAGKGYSGARR